MSYHVTIQSSYIQCIDLTQSNITVVEAQEATAQILLLGICCFISTLIIKHFPIAPLISLLITSRSHYPPCHLIHQSSIKPQNLVKCYIYFIIKLGLASGKGAVSLGIVPLGYYTRIKGLKLIYCSHKTGSILHRRVWPHLYYTPSPTDQPFHPSFPLRLLLSIFSNYDLRHYLLTNRRQRCRVHNI